MIKQLIFCATAFLFSAAGGAAAIAATADAPFGLDVDGREYALISNTGWQVSTDGGAHFVRPRLASLIRTATSGAKSALDRQSYAYIWAPTCVASKQTLIFRRTFYLPGAAKTFGAQFGSSTGFGDPDNQAISSTKITINGQPVFGINGAGKRIQTGANAFAHFVHLGTNLVTITVVKRADGGPTTSIGHCKYGNPAKPLGIYFQMVGTFDADLWLAKDSSSIEHYQRPENPDRQLFMVGAAPLNLGPSEAYKGTLIVEVTGDQVVVSPSNVTVSGTGLRNCKLSQASAFKAHLECEIFRFPAHATPRVTFPALVKFHPGYENTSVFIYRTVQSPTNDPNLGTNDKREFFNFCGPTATNPKCPPLP